MKRLTSLIAIGLFSTSVAAFEMPTFGMEGLKNHNLAPYIGADAQFHRMHIRGGNFSQSTVNGNFYGGLQLSDITSFEVGFTKGNKSNHTGKDYYKTRAIHLGLVTKQPVVNTENLDVLIGAGFGASKALFHHHDSGLDTHRKKAIPRILVGIQYALNENVAFRAAGTWENTRSLEASHPVMGTVKPDNSMNYSVGLNYAF